MKMVTKIAVIATFATMMFAGINVTWGHSYSDATGTLMATDDFGLSFDINDATTVGWETANGLTVGLAGPAGTTMRMGFDGNTSLGVSRSWWSSTGAGWGTTLNSTVDFVLTGAATAGDFRFGINLGFGF